jgi:hypothetical protein
MAEVGDSTGVLVGDPEVVFNGVEVTVILIKDEK